MEKLSSIAKNRCQAAENTRRENRLVGCMIGKGALTFTHPETTTGGKKRKRSGKSGQSLFPCPMPTNQTCWALGFYIITDIWKQQVLQTDGKGHQPVTMVRLERWKLEDKAWFASTDSSHDPPRLSDRDLTSKAPHETCQTCQQTSPRMFEEFFLCRNADCDDFWKHEGKVQLEPLTYTKPYLQQRGKRDPDGYKPYGAYKGDDNTFPTAAVTFPDWWEKHYNAVRDDPITKDNFGERMRDLNKGFWCPDCGMLNRRLKWSVWDCANSTCSAKWPGHPSIVPAARIVEIGKTAPPNWSTKPGYTGSEDTGDHIRHNFDLRYGCGVTVIVPKQGTNAQLQGSDWLFDRFQQLANADKIYLQRQFVPSPSGGTVTNHFIHNYGKPYKLGVDIQLQSSFEEAPPELSHARDSANLLCRRYQSSLDGAEDFNECYVAGYFTDNHMGWHDDGEDGLGNVIATWTLGGEGRMFICADVDQYFGRDSSNKVIEEDLLLVAVHKEEGRRKLKEKLDVDLAVVPPLTEDQKKTIREQYREDLGKLVGNRADKADCHQALELPLTHGSIVVMHGEKMQKYYKHSVKVNTPFRVALTFRHIKDENAKVNVRGRKNWEYPHVPDKSYLDEFNKDSEDEEEAPSKRRKNTLVLRPKGGQSSGTKQSGQKKVKK